MSSPHTLNTSDCSNRTVIIGNSMDINIDPCSCESELRADVVVSHFTAIRIWGQIVDCNSKPVPNALVKLVKIVEYCGTKDYEGISHTVSDCSGFYQFDICSDENAWYKILVGKSNTGKEVIISTANTHCPDSPEACECCTCHDMPPS